MNELYPWALKAYRSGRMWTGAALRTFQLEICTGTAHSTRDFSVKTCRRVFPGISARSVPVLLLIYTSVSVPVARRISSSSHDAVGVISWKAVSMI